MTSLRRGSISVSTIIFFQSCSDSKNKNVSELIKIKGLIYYRDTNKPFTGVATAYYSKDQQKKSETECKDGLIDGTETIWYKSGKKKARKKYLKGKLHGESIFWYKNGQRKAIETYKKGKPAGRQKSWKKDGVLTKDKIIH